jgi:hypothetical protein
MNETTSAMTRLFGPTRDGWLWREGSSEEHSQDWLCHMNRGARLRARSFIFWRRVVGDLVRGAIVEVEARGFLAI